MIVNFFVKIIEFYQRYISPDSGVLKERFPGGYCKYTPTCSEYFKQSLIKKGFALGFLRGLWRIVRCNPWSKGGYDPVV